MNWLSTCHAGGREFPPLLRVKSFILSLLAASFLMTPCVVAVRDSHTERSRINEFSRLFLSDQEASFEG